MPLFSECNYAGYRAFGLGVSGHGHYYVPTPAECRELCEGEDGCVAWTWLTAINTPANRCSLKRPGFRMEPSDTTLVMSGIKQCNLA